MTIELTKEQATVATRALREYRRIMVDFYDANFPEHDYRVFPEYNAINDALNEIRKSITLSKHG